MSGPIVIVGAGQAGLQIAESLRAENYDGPLTLIGDEPHPPYQRPPLSKALLSGETTEDRLIIRGPDVFARKAIDLVTGTRVSAIDRAAKQVRLSDGHTLSYGGLALATGSRARPLPIPGAMLDGVVMLRTIEDSRRIGEALDTATNVVVIGGGFIGLEVAATARKRGRNVILLEALDRLMARSVAPLVSDFFADVHRGHGVDIRFGAKVASLEGHGGSVTGVTTDDGQHYPADLVVVGVGVIANDELAQECGLTCERGIIVDTCSRTSDPAIVAAGDCTAHRRADGTLLRLESVQNAIEQGKSAAAALMGHERPFVAAPWFWSDQYDIKLQMAGLSAGHDRIVVRGAQPAQAFSVFYFKGSKLVGVDSMNRPHDHMAARKLLDKGVSPTPEQAADESFALAGLLK